MLSYTITNEIIAYCVSTITWSVGQGPDRYINMTFKHLVSHKGNNSCKIFIILIISQLRTMDSSPYIYIYIYIYRARSITFTDECSSSLRRLRLQVQRFKQEKYPHFSSSQQCPRRFKSSGIWHRVDWCEQLKKFWSSLLLLSSDSTSYIVQLQTYWTIQKLRVQLTCLYYTLSVLLYYIHKWSQNQTVAQYSFFNL